MTTLCERENVDSMTDKMAFLRRCILANSSFCMVQDGNVVQGGVVNESRHVNARAAPLIRETDATMI